MYLARDMELGTFWAIKQLPLSMKKEAEIGRASASSESFIFTKNDRLYRAG